MDWYAARTRYHHERLVSQCCDRAEVVNYVPWIEEDRKWNGKRAHIIYPLISGFVFVRADSPLKLVARIVGFLKWVEFNHQPGVVTEEEIATMKLACHPEFKPQPATHFATGTEVLVANGPFKGNKGIVLSQGQEFVRLQIGVGVLGGFSVQIPAGDLK